MEHDRPDFKGDMMVSFVDGSPMTYYPPEVSREFLEPPPRRGLRLTVVEDVKMSEIRYTAALSGTG